MIGIYGIRNKINNKIYVGQTTNIDARYKEHWKNLKNQCHQNSHLQNAWNKYGEECFEFIIIDECSYDRLNEREQYWIDYYGGVSSKNTYNIREAGSSGHHSDETKQKLREQRLGKKLSDNTKLKISEAQKGICRIVTEEQKQRHKNAVIRGCNTEKEHIRRSASAKRQWENIEFRNKMTELWRGRHHTEETKKLQSSIAKERCATSEFKKVLAKANAKEVCEFGLNGTLWAVFPSVLEASRVTGIPSRCIYSSCGHDDRKSQSLYNCYWRYSKDVKNI